MSVSHARGCWTGDSRTQRSPRSRPQASSGAPSGPRPRYGPTAVGGTPPRPTTRPSTATSCATTASSGAPRAWTRPTRTCSATPRCCAVRTYSRWGRGPPSARGGCSPRAPGRWRSTCPASSCGTRAPSTPAGRYGCRWCRPTPRRCPFADGSFDIVCSAFGAVPFVADSGAVMAEAFRVLRPGGRWVFSVTHPVRWCLPDDPGPAGLQVTWSYFDHRPYVEVDENDQEIYVEHHRTMGDRVREIVAAGLVLLDVVEPEWPPGHDRELGPVVAAARPHGARHRDLRDPETRLTPCGSRGSASCSARGDVTARREHLCARRDKMFHEPRLVSWRRLPRPSSPRRAARPGPLPWSGGPARAPARRRQADDAGHQERGVETGGERVVDRVDQLGPAGGRSLADDRRATGRRPARWPGRTSR